MDDKEKRAKKELNKLKKLFKDLPENKNKLCEKLIQNAAFQSATLEELQAQIKADGAVITVKNGNGFDVTQEHPAQKSYNTMYKNYLSTVKQLAEFLPEQVTKSKLTEFLNGQ